MRDGFTVTAPAVAVLFVASDSTEAKNVIRANTRHVVITVSSKARHSNGSMGLKKNIDILAESFADMLTVGSCDYVVGTWRSTFSVVAAAFQGRIPYFVARRKACFQPTYVDYCNVCLTRRTWFGGIFLNDSDSQSP